MPKLRSTYDGRLIYKITKNARLFSGTIHLQNREIVRDSVLKLTGDIHTGSLARYKSLS